MTSSYEDQYVLKPDLESSAGHEGAVAELTTRIEAEDASLQFTRRPDGIAVPSLAAAERVINNHRINREGCELYLDVDPFWANVAH